MVEFNRRGRLSTGRVRDQRGSSGVPGGKLAVGGVGGLVLLVVAALAGIDPSVLLQATGAGGGGEPPAGGGLEACETTADIDTTPECRFVAFENSVQDFWADTFEANGVAYEYATLTVFTGGVSTACGSASSAMGPFYCPADQGVYMDLGFFDVLVERLGATGGDFAEAYVVAHEVGHHVQNVLGTNRRVQSREGPESDGVRLELQADCYAGVWAHHATRTPTAAGGAPVISEISDEDIAEAIDAAETVGDDYIQTRSQGNVTPETWTHGSSEQRRTWFGRGLDTGDPEACDTFAPDAEL